MPIAILDRIPFPNLRAYTSGSVLALSACVFYATQIIKDPNWESVSNDIESNAQFGFNTTNSSDPDGRTMRKYMGDIFTVLVREPICVWTMINMAFCWLILIGTAIQKLVFGELRVSEQQHLKDKFWNFIFYKFIFVFGIINVQYIDEVLLWCSWFAFLGFLHLLSQLSNDRFEYLSFSPTTPVWSHVKLLVLLGVIFALSGFMLLVAVFVGFFGGINTFAFMSAEVILLSVRTLHIIIKYALHLYDMRHENALPIVPNEESKVWERRGPVIYYTELSFEMIALVIDFVHHLHMLIWSNIFLSMASLVICMQMRYLFQEIQRKYKKHRNYVWVRNHLELNYPMATSAELTENSDNCAVCWEKMESARKLPCGHLFHNTCLLSWLEQDTTCPTCRMALNIQNPAVARIESPDLQMDPPQIVRRQLNHFFHFDGSRYVSWLPSFSVEVSHAQLVRQETMASNSQLDAMARQVQELFPNMPMSVITEDLRSTRSVEQTVENVLDGRLVAPPIFREPETISVRRPTGMTHPSTTFSNEDISTKNWEEYTAETVETDDTSSLGSRFSKSSQEREKILQKRKENLIHRARKRYIDKRRSTLSPHSDFQS